MVSNVNENVVFSKRAKFPRLAAPLEINIFEIVVSKLSFLDFDQLKHELILIFSWIPPTTPYHPILAQVFWPELSSLDKPVKILSQICTIFWSIIVGQILRNIFVRSLDAKISLTEFRDQPQTFRIFELLLQSSGLNHNL